MQIDKTCMGRITAHVFPSIVGLWCTLGRRQLVNNFLVVGQLVVISPFGRRFLFDIHNDDPRETLPHSYSSILMYIQRSEKASNISLPTVGRTFGSPSEPFGNLREPFRSLSGIFGIFREKHAAGPAVCPATTAEKAKGNYQIEETNRTSLSQ